MAEVIAPKCPNCGAAVEIPEAAPGVLETSAPCPFCKAKVVVRRHAPSAFQPIQSALELRRMLGSPQRPPARVMGKALAAATLIPIVLPLLIVFLSVGVPRIRKAWKTSHLPLVCERSQTLVLDGLDGDVAGTAITARDFCNLTIRRSTIKADTVVAAEDHVILRVEDSRLEGRTAAITAESYLSLDARGATTLLSGGKVGLGLGDHSTVKLRQGRIASPDVGAQLRSHTSVELRDRAELRGRTALDAGEMLRLSLRDGSAIRGEDVAVTTSGRIDLTIDNASVEGGSVAIRARDHGQVRVRRGKVKSAGTAITVGIHHGIDLTGESVVDAGEAIVVGDHGRVTIDGSRVGASGTALRGGSHVRLRIDRGELRGAVALDTGEHLSVEESQATIAGERRTRGAGPDGASGSRVRR